VIVVLIDTLRSDHVDALGAKKGLSPCMDRLAEQGFLFQRALAPSSWTKPSVASLFTGLYPGRHGAIGTPVSFNGRASALDPALVTLAEQLKSAGYHTAAFATNPQIIADFHFDQGFDRFVQPAGTAGELLNRALEWIKDRQPGERYFTYLHLIDPHEPYFPPQEFRERYGRKKPGKGALFVREGIPLGIKQWARQFKRWQPPPSGEGFSFDYKPLAGIVEQGFPDLDPKKLHERVFLDFSGMEDPALLDRIDYLTSHYRGEVAYADNALADFVGGLEKLGLLDDILLVVTGDHGETFLEHGNWGHGYALHIEEVDVPLLIRTPGTEGPFKGASNDPVSLVDIYPTVLDFLGLSLPKDLDGTTLGPVIRGEKSKNLASRIVFSELIHEKSDQVAAVRGLKKVIRRVEAKGEVQWQCFDLAVDPQELHPVTPSQQDKQEYLTLGKAIEYRLKMRTLDHEGKGPKEALSEEVMEQMRALGYF